MLVTKSLKKQRCISMSKHKELIMGFGGMPPPLQKSLKVVQLGAFWSLFWHIF